MALIDMGTRGQKRSIVPLAGLLAAILVLTVIFAHRAGANDFHPQVREGHALSIEGKLEEANRMYSARLSTDKNDIAAVRGMAVNLFLMRRYDQALPFQQLVVKLDDRDAQTRVELGLNYLVHQDEPLEATFVLREAATIDPSPRNRTLLAKALVAAGDPPAAVYQLRSVLASAPEYDYARQTLVQLEREP